MLTVNTNVTSLGAQRTLNNSTSSLSSSLQRLSSGLRINGAKDDAAGLSIASRMTAQIRGVGQAIRNANDGISVAQTAEGGLNQVGDMLQRMRELAVQSANGSNSSGDRKTIQNEISQLYQEIDRISGATEFNGQKLFSGSDALNDKSFQIGANANQTISYKIGEVSTKTLGLNSSVADGQTYSGRVSGNAPLAGNTELVINGKAVTMAATDITATLQEVAINNASSVTGVSADAFNNVQGSSATVSATKLVTGLTINGTTVDSSSSLEQLAENINKQVGGITASIGDKGNLVLANDTGANIVVGGTVANSGLTAGTFNGMLAFKSADGSDIKFATGSGVASSALAKFGLNASTGNGSVQTAGNVPAAAASQALAITALGPAAKYDPSALNTDIVKINGVTVGATAGNSAADGAAAINAIKGQTGVSAAAKTIAALDLDFSVKDAATKITINGTTVNLDTTGPQADVAKVVTAINAAGIQGVVAEADTKTGKLVLRSESGSDILISDGDGLGANGKGFLKNVYDDPSGTNTQAIAANQSVGVRGKIALTADNGGSIRIDGDGSSSGGTGLAKFGLVAQNGNDNVVGGGLNVLTVASANKAMEAIDKAINKVNEKRSELGAVQNRFSNTISNLQISSENLSASRSRIQDADFAAETAALSRNQILQQAGTAMLAQANQLPQQVMQLLR